MTCTKVNVCFHLNYAHVTCTRICIGIVNNLITLNANSKERRDVPMCITSVLCLLCTLVANQVISGQVLYCVLCIGVAIDC